MTPWAELLLDPVSTDGEVRSRYHDLIRTEHPDLRSDRRAGPRWAALVAAYKTVATAGGRAAWVARWARMSGVCPGCGGAGVRVRALGRNRGVRICERCEGEGRMR